MSFQRREATPPVRGVCIASVVILCAMLALTLGAEAHARAGDRFRCTPADGGASYTSPGSCRSSTDSREPLTEQEKADSMATESRGRAFVRCTAADGRYSKFVNEGECPSATDIRTIEYAKQPIQSTPQRSPSTEPPATLLEPPAPITPAPVAFSPIPQTLPSSVSAARSGAGMAVKLGLLALVVLGVWGVFKLLGRRQEQSKADQREARAKTIIEKRKNPEPGEQLRRERPVADRIDMHQKAQDFLASLDAGTDVPGGMAFRRELQQSRLDYSVESLDRVEQLLSQIRIKLSPQRESWQSRIDANNFCLMLAFYLGAVVSRQADVPIQWHTRDQAAPLMPPDMPIPEAGWARVVGIIGTSACVPLGLIEDKLFSDSGGMTCKAYVERLVTKLRSIPAMDENQRCAQMLDAFFNDTEITGGLAFREQLKRRQLDYSLSSLERLDQMLRSIRAKLKPTYTDCVNNTDTQNFLRLVAFYICMTVARVGNIPVKWLSFAEARMDISELEFQFETTSVCLLSGRTYYPLGLLTEILLSTDPQRSLPVWASEALSLAPPPIPSILRSSAQLDSAGPLDDQWALAIHQAGFVAAWCMFTVAGGTNGAPTVFVPAEGKKGSFRDFSFYESVESATAAANSLMETNPDNAPFQVMSFDGYANLHTGRTDALTIELRIYADGGSSEQNAFTMHVACPYRNAKDPKGFAIFSPKLLECSAATTMQSAIFKHFYLGINEFKVTDFDWFKHLDERI